MRKVLIAILLAVLLWGCGGDNSTNNGGISVSILPLRALVDFGDTTQFFASVGGTADTALIWKVNNIVEGDSVYGTIDSHGFYIAPLIKPTDTDSVKISAVLSIDETKTATAWAILLDPSRIYVSIFGNDTTGVGSDDLPYRTITKALNRARTGHTIYVSPGDFNTAAGEIFPLVIFSGITVRGSGSDSTFVTGPGGVIGDPSPWARAAFEVYGDFTTVERMLIRSTNSLGVGVWIRQGTHTSLSNNIITSQNIGAYISGSASIQVIAGNHFNADSIGVVTADSVRPILRNNYIYDCSKYGIDIRDLSRPDLGANDSTNVGNDTIQRCGGSQFHWLIYNGTPNTIRALGNYWQDPVIDNNDIYIYDDEESGGASGDVIISNSRKR